MVLSKEEREKRRKIRRSKAITIIVVILLFAFGILFCLKSSIFNVQNISVRGNTYYTASEILTMGNFSLGENIFNGLDYKNCKERLLKDTYIKGVTIEKELPNTIIVNVVERQQIAVCMYGAQCLVIDEDGILLRKSESNPEITVLTGFTLNNIEIGSMLGVDEEIEFRYVLSVLSAMKDNDMFFYSIGIKDGIIKAHVLENLICEGTPKNIVDSLNNNTLQAAVSKILLSGIERGTLKITDNSSTDGVIFSPMIDGE